MSESKFATVNGLRLHYLDYGTAGQPALVCIHGLTGNAHNFDAVAPRLSASYHVLSLDVRGRGDSAWGPPAQYTVPVYVGDLGALLDALAIRRASLIGTSMGGIISIALAGSYPERVERVVLNDIGPEVDAAGGQRIAGYVTTAPNEFASIDEVVAYYRQNYPPMVKMPEALMADFVKWSVKPTATGRLTWKMDPAVRRAMGGATVRLDLWEPYRRITAPILIVRGAQGDILSSATAARMCRESSRAHLVEVPGVGHAPSLSEPESVKALAEFLT